MYTERCRRDSRSGGSRAGFLAGNIFMGQYHFWCCRQKSGNLSRRDLEIVPGKLVDRAEMMRNKAPRKRAKTGCFLPIKGGDRYTRGGSMFLVGSCGVLENMYFACHGFSPEEPRKQGCDGSDPSCNFSPPWPSDDTTSSRCDDRVDESLVLRKSVVIGIRVDKEVDFVSGSDRYCYYSNWFFTVPSTCY